jgi:tetratricopeptide (TPR) repeat protein
VPLFQAAEFELAEALLAAAEAAALRLGPDPATFARIKAARSIRAMTAGNPEAAYLEHREAAGAYEQAGDMRYSCLANMNCGYYLAEMGRLAEAEAPLREALASGERVGIPYVAAAAKQNLGVVQYRIGALEAARRLESEAAEAFRQQGEHRLEGGSRIYLALILLEFGHFADAEREAREAISILDTAPAIRAYAHGALARILLTTGRLDDALTTARGAMALVDSLGTLEEGDSATRLVFAEALEAAGEHEQARGAIARARDHLLERAARFRDPIVRQSFFENIAEHARTLALADAWLEGRRSGDS